jgi:hypothetical protein
VVTFNVPDGLGEIKKWEVSKEVWEDDKHIKIDWNLNENNDDIQIGHYTWLHDKDNYCEIDDLRYMWKFFKRLGLKELPF